MVKFEERYDHQCPNLSIPLLRKNDKWVLERQGSLGTNIIVEFVISMLKSTKKPWKTKFQKKMFHHKGDHSGAAHVQ